MSAGDVDDTLGPADELRRLRGVYADLDSYLSGADRLPIVRASIPFGAGISEDGATRYIDSRLNCVVDNIDCSLALATHESTEWALREFCGIGLDYAADPRGHRLANRAEYTRVLSLGRTWEAYDDFIDPQIREIEHAPLIDVPKDLALYPYESDSALVEKLKAAQARAKLTMQEVGYRIAEGSFIQTADHPTSERYFLGQRCGNCSMYSPEGQSCSLVRGVIGAEFVCDCWEAKP